MLISIRALAVRDNKNGTFSIELPSAELSAKQSEMIRELFPNLSDRVYLILEQEALLSALATTEQLQAPPSLGKATNKPAY